MGVGHTVDLLEESVRRKNVWDCYRNMNFVKNATDDVRIRIFDGTGNCLVRETIRGRRSRRHTSPVSTQKLDLDRNEFPRMRVEQSR